MTDPEEALDRARAAAASMRAAGAYEEDLAGRPPEPDTLGRKLLEWAVIEPDLEEVRSTRRLGAPMTALKRLLVRLLNQYHAELLGQQTRFNVNVVGQLRRLEERIGELERSAGTGERSAGTGERSAGTGERSAGTGERSAGTGERSAGTGERSAGTGERRP